jgi:peptide/nickel transport system permease protein
MLRRAASRFLRHRLAVAGAVFLLAVGAVAVLAPIVAPHSPTEVDIRAFRSPPSPEHPLGTDLIGRDVLSRLIYASQVSLTIGVLASSLAVVIGTALGAIAGYYRGSLDAVLMRLTDMVLAFPPLVIVLVAVSVIGPSIESVILVLGGLTWPTSCRIVRSSYLSLRELEFTLAARTVGAGDGAIILRHLLPNALGPVLVAASLGAAGAILSEAALSFIGLGVQPPTPSWGNMLVDAQSLTILRTMPWIWLPPGLAILLTVLAINFVGDGIRDALDPRSWL